MRGDDRASAVIGRAEHRQNCNEAIAALEFEVADRNAPGTVIGLPRDRFDEVVGQFWRLSRDFEITIISDSLLAVAIEGGLSYQHTTAGI